MIYSIIVIFVLVFGSVVFLMRQKRLKMCGSKIKVMDLKNPVMPENLLISLTSFFLIENQNLFYNTIPNYFIIYQMPLLHFFQV